MCNHPVADAIQDAGLSEAVMKIKLIKFFKNHQVGEVLDVSKRIYDHLLKLGCIADPRKIEFMPDVVKAAAEIEEPKKSSKEKSKEKK